MCCFSLQLLKLLVCMYTMLLACVLHEARSCVHSPFYPWYNCCVCCIYCWCQNRCLFVLNCFNCCTYSRNCTFQHLSVYSLFLLCFCNKNFDCSNIHMYVHTSIVCISGCKVLIWYLFTHFFFVSFFGLPKPFCQIAWNFMNLILYFCNGNFSSWKCRLKCHFKMS